MVKPGASLSLQMHHHRAEHWIVVSGTAEVTCGDKVILLSENQSTYIPLGEVHRLANPGKVPLEIIEVQSGQLPGRGRHRALRGHLWPREVVAPPHMPLNGRVRFAPAINGQSLLTRGPWPARDPHTTMKVLVTGAAGFIGMHVSQILLARGDSVVGLDNLNDYYDPQLKLDRLARLTPNADFRFVQDGRGRPRRHRRSCSPTRSSTASCTWRRRPACATRWSTRTPTSTATSSASPTSSKAAATTRVQHLAYASSSSVYGGNTAMPFSEHHNVDHPVSLYAATKKANELMAHTYSHLFGLPTTGLRFFTVYGPWGRPDMALFLFTKAILAGEPIQVFNHGKMVRDFTYIDDIVEGVVRVLDRPATVDPASTPPRRTRRAAMRPTACSTSATTTRCR